MIRNVIDWYYGKASIRKKLVISYMFLVLVPMIVLGCYSYRIAKNNLIRQTKETIKSNVSSICYNLQTDIERENDNLKYLSYNATFRKKLEEGKVKPIVLARELTDNVEPVLWYFITSDRNIKGIDIFSSYIEKPIGSFLKPEEECIGEGWYKYHKTDFKPLWSFEDGNLFLSRTILDEATSSRSIGVIKLNLYPERFLEPVYTAEYLENGYVLLDKKGQIISQRSISDQNLERLILKDVTAGTGAGQKESGQYILEVSEPLENGWQLFYYIDKVEINAGIQEIIRSTLLVIGICLVVVIILLSIISKILTTRVMKLKLCAEEVGKGHFEIQIERGYTDEIGIVADSFYKMSSRIREMMGEMYQLGLEKRATELKALQAMINPHFLYNCLSGIKWKAIRSDQEEIADITGLLAKFYRTALNNGKQITTVQNELDNIKAYLEIQSRTHENSFCVKYRIDEEGLQYEMPNFLLQPIVENAICHGIDYCDEVSKGEIIVEYEAGEEYLYFRIFNNGPRLTSEELSKVLSTPGKGYGLFNIRERIDMYYDDSCGLEASITETDYTCFCVRIRKEMKTFLTEKKEKI